MPGENVSYAGLNTQEEMHCCLREILDKIEVDISDHFLHLQEFESHFGFLCSSESLVNQFDLQNHEEFTELQNKCTYLPHQYSRLEWIGTISGLQECHNFRQKRKTGWGKSGFFSKGTAQIYLINGTGGK
jgi:hypothetical protein